MREMRILVAGFSKDGKSSHKEILGSLQSIAQHRLHPPAEAANRARELDGLHWKVPFSPETYTRLTLGLSD